MGLFDRADLRIAVMDIEASGFGEDSYPIEVGLALIAGDTTTIGCWSTLIRPTDEWKRNGLWSTSSQAVHGIVPEALEQAMPAPNVAQLLNDMLRRTIVVSDAPTYDQAWLNRLYDTADIEPCYVLQDFDALAGDLDAAEYRRFVELLEKSPIPHRAGADALRLASALMESRLRHPPKVRDLHPAGVSGT